VVSRHTVLTAAHMVFDPVTLTYMGTNSVWWFFERQAGEYEPQPQVLRGWYVLSGYASARTNDIIGSLGLNSDQSSPETQRRDVAAMFFLGTNGPGRGGYSGYLTSDTSSQTGHVWVAEASQKLLVGYPVEGIPAENRGRMHRAGPGIAAFNPISANIPEVYASSDMAGYPGMSGGPLCVLSYDSLGDLYLLPAAVYLGADDNGRCLVRVIDLDVVNLVRAAEDTALVGSDRSGGGVVLVSPSYGSTVQNYGKITVTLGPPAAIRLGGRWRISPTNYGNLWYITNYTTNSVQVPVDTSGFAIEVKSLPGFQSPTNRSLRVGEGATIPLDLFYSVNQPRLTLDPTRGLGILGTTGTAYQIQAAPRVSAQMAWSPVTNTASISNGTNWILVPGHPQSNIFYRAKWLTQ